MKRKLYHVLFVILKTIWTARAAIFWSATLNTDNESITRYFKLDLN